MDEERFGTQLKIFRIKNGIAQKEMAASLEYSAPYLCGIENGTREVPIDFLQRLCQKYNVDLDSLEAMQSALHEEQMRREKQKEKQHIIHELIREVKKEDVTVEQVQNLLKKIQKD